MNTVKRYYPIFLNLENKHCLVVGGGNVGCEKASGLLQAGASVNVVSKTFTAAFRELAAADQNLTLQKRPYAAGEAVNYYLVIAATGDAATDLAVYGDASEKNVLVNAADYPKGCDFILPARFKAGEVQVAVSTGGASPALATWIRDLIAADLGQEIAVLAEMLKETRSALKKSGNMPDKMLWRELLDSGLLEQLRNGNKTWVRQQIELFLTNHSRAVSPKNN